MKLLFGIELINNRHRKYAIIDVWRRIRGIYIKSGNEAAYSAYRAITGASVQDSWKAVKPWIKVWEGK